MQGPFLDSGLMFCAYVDFGDKVKLICYRYINLTLSFAYWRI